MIKKIYTYIFKLLDLLFVSLIYYISYPLLPKDIWIISERPYEACDNGYNFFCYLRTHHNTKNIYYLIEKKSPHRGKVEKLQNVLYYKSLKHKVFFLASKKIISTEKNIIEPWGSKFFNKYFSSFYPKKKNIFLQHGIIQNDISDTYGAKVSKIDLFITSAKEEYDFILEKFGYDDKVVKCTGLARYDNLVKIDGYKFILLMPTWRRNIMQPSLKKEMIIQDKVFLDSTYYKTYLSFINNGDLIKQLQDSGYEILFLPHYEVQKYLKYFKSKSNNIKILDPSEYDIQDILRKAVMLITDYSSINFDFAYMKKALCYYQFDEKDYYKYHQEKGYFDFVQKGFGPVFKKEKEIVNYIKNEIENNFYLDNKYIQKVDQFFTFKDTCNCKRILKEIENLD